MQTGWQTVNGKKYYFKTNGAAELGWKLWDGYWYYLNKPDGYVTTGMMTLDGKIYAFDSSGRQLFGWQAVNGKKYFFKSNGGAAEKGWKLWNGNWYFLDRTTAVMATGTRTVDGTTQTFDANGVWQFKKTMGNAYMNLIRSSQNTYGTSNVFAYLLDFDNDGKDELILCDGNSKAYTKVYSYIYGKTNLLYDKQSFIPEAGFFLAIYKKNSKYYILEGVTGLQCFEYTYGMTNNKFENVGSYIVRIVSNNSRYEYQETRTGIGFSFDSDTAYLKINLENNSTTSAMTNETISRLKNMN